MRHLVLIAASALVLSGCDAIDNPLAPTQAAAPQTNVLPSARRAGRGTDRDIEAPDLFSTTDQGLWDGRPSLGGVWVASPDAVDPERVLIRNTANDQSVVGALFRRERDNPGPRLQVSSDAAAALGMLAGAPAKLSVVALRRNEAPAPPPEARPAVSPPDGDAEAPRPDAAAAQPATAPAADTPAPERRQPFWRRRAAPPSDADAAVPGDAPAAGIAPAATAAATAAPSAAPAAGSLVQIGIFNVEANAAEAARGLASAGVPTDVRREESRGKPSWRLIAVPGASADSATLLARVRDLGFKDAFLVSR